MISLNSACGQKGPLTLPEKKFIFKSDNLDRNKNTETKEKKTN